jgi:hypothetical protein
MLNSRLVVLRKGYKLRAFEKEKGLVKECQYFKFVFLMDAIKQSNSKNLWFVNNSVISTF